MPSRSLMASVIVEVDSLLQGQVQQEAETGTGLHAPNSGLHPQRLVRSCAGLSVRMTSRGIGQKGILANRVAVVTGSTDG